MDCWRVKYKPGSMATSVDSNRLRSADTVTMPISRRRAARLPLAPRRRFFFFFVSFLVSTRSGYRFGLSVVGSIGIDSMSSATLPSPNCFDDVADFSCMIELIISIGYYPNESIKYTNYYWNNNEKKTNKLDCVVGLCSSWSCGRWRGNRNGNSYEKKNWFSRYCFHLSVVHPYHP